MDKISFERFTEMVMDGIQEWLPEQFQAAEISLKKTKRNNGICYTALLIADASKGNTVPCVYLEPLYDRYARGAKMEAIFKDIVERRVENELGVQFDTSILTDIDKCRGRILPCLVGTENNENMLEDRPHVVIADLAVVFCINLSGPDSQNANIPIQNQMLEMWDVDTEELYSIAVQNLEASGTGVFRSLNEVMADIMPGGSDDDLAVRMPEEDLMYVLTNEANIYGASMLLDRAMMGRIVERFGEPIILPSSVHEILVLPDRGKWKKEELEAMVREVNDTQVRVEERLSYSIYKYTANGIVRL